jgi:hypothetical protein
MPFRRCFIVSSQEANASTRSICFLGKQMLLVEVFATSRDACSAAAFSAFGVSVPEAAFAAFGVSVLRTSAVCAVSGVSVLQEPAHVLPLDVSFV